MSPALVVASVQGLAMVQAPSRAGWMHHGVPAGGPLVPELFARANVAAGNDPRAPAIELAGAMRIEAHGDLHVATEDGEARAVRRGDALAIPPRPDLRVRYVAVRGGIDVPRVLGGKGTLLGAGIGGFEGRALRAGDVLPLGHETGHSARPAAAWASREYVRVLPGPDVDRFAPGALSALASGPYVVSPSSTRAGSRLVAAPPILPSGAPVASPLSTRMGVPLRRVDRDDARSAPMVPGAIQVPAGGEPIVLGPDHPTTGGYPVIAVILREDLGPFHAIPLGGRVRFVVTRDRGDPSAPFRVV